MTLCERRSVKETALSPEPGSAVRDIQMGSSRPLWRGALRAAFFPLLGRDPNRGAKKKEGCSLGGQGQGTARSLRPAEAGVNRVSL